MPPTCLSSLLDFQSRAGTVGKIRFDDAELHGKMKRNERRPKALVPPLSRCLFRDAAIVKALSIGRENRGWPALKRRDRGYSAGGTNRRASNR